MNVNDGQMQVVANGGRTAAAPPDWRTVYGYDVPPIGAFAYDSKVRTLPQRQTTDIPSRTSPANCQETGLDYFGARYFSGAQGRFTSPDAPLADQHVEDPQSWNLYGYVRNNPLRFVDPLGRECVNGVSSTDSSMACFTNDPDPIITNPFFTAVAAGANRAAPYVETLAAATPFMPVAAAGVALAVPAAPVVATAGTVAVGAAETPQGQKAIQAAQQSGIFSGPGAYQAAQTWQTTTQGAQLMQQVTPGTPVGPASAAYAEAASGTIQVFHSIEGVQINSAWATSEFPALVNNPNVTGAVLNFTNGAGKVVSTTTKWPWFPF